MIALNKRKILIILLIAILLTIIVLLIGFFVFLPKKPIRPKVEKKPSQVEEEKAKQEAIENVTAPERKEPLSKEEKEELERTLESLTAPKK